MFHNTDYELPNHFSAMSFPAQSDMMCVCRFRVRCAHILPPMGVPHTGRCRGVAAHRQCPRLHARATAPLSNSEYPKSVFAANPNIQAKNASKKSLYQNYQRIKEAIASTSPNLAMWTIHKIRIFFKHNTWANILITTS